MNTSSTSPAGDVSRSASSSRTAHARRSSRFGAATNAPSGPSRVGIAARRRQHGPRARPDARGGELVRGVLRLRPRIAPGRRRRRRRAARCADSGDTWREPNETTAGTVTTSPRRSTGPSPHTHGKASPTAASRTRPSSNTRFTIAPISSLWAASAVAGAAPRPVILEQAVAGPVGVQAARRPGDPRGSRRSRPRLRTAPAARRAPRRAGTWPRDPWRESVQARPGRLLSYSLAVPLGPAAIDRAAALLERARLDVTTIPELPEDVRPRDLADAYAISDRLDERLGWEVAGWYLGRHERRDPGAARPRRAVHGAGLRASAAHEPGHAARRRLPADGDRVRVRVRARAATWRRATTPYSRDEVAAAVDSVHAAHRGRGRAPRGLDAPGRLVGDRRQRHGRRA